MVGVVGIFPSEPLDHVARAWVTDRVVVRLAASECNRRLVACSSHRGVEVILSQQAFGIRCPCCKGNRSRVLYKRLGRGYIRRRHECLTCRDKARWTTYEFLRLRRGVISVPDDLRAIRSASTLK
jgi:hypothetical protein